MKDFPAEPACLVQIVQGLLLHKFEVEHYNVQLSPVKNREHNLRTVRQMLERLQQIDAAPLTVARPPQERLVVICRDFAVLMVSFLRQAGIPARMRVGFAAYLDPTGQFRYDHWISEYWHAQQQRWVLLDSQIDEIQRQAFALQCDPLDLVRDRDFYPAGAAWQLARSGKVRSTLFRFNGHWKGFPNIRYNLVNDLHALNKFELAPGDIADSLSTKPEVELTVEDKAILDRIATLTHSADPNAAELQQLFYSLPGTQATIDRLRLLGVVDVLSLTTPDHLQTSDANRLAQLTQGNGLKPKRLPAVETYVPYDLPPQLLNSHAGTSAAAFGIGDIIIRGAQQHNLKHIDVTIPRHRLVVVTGVSGSGKSSLAFDTIYAEGQRRYVESLSSYARQFMEQMEKPRVDQITGLSPAIAIEQKTVSKNPRSTVGTVTEILDYLRVLFARIGLPHCPQCGRAVQPQTDQQITTRLIALPPGTRFQVMAPIAYNRKGTHNAALKQAARAGFTRARVNGQPLDLTNTDELDALNLDKNRKHNIEVVVDRLIAPEVIDDEYRLRLADSVETALKTGSGQLIVSLDQEEIVLSDHNACPYCDLSFPEMQPQMFSFNSPFGMCPECNGLGIKLQVDPNLIVENPQLSVLDGASRWFGDVRKKKADHWISTVLDTMAEHYQVDLHLPWKDLPEDFQNVLLYGSGDTKFSIKRSISNGDSAWNVESVSSFKGVVHDINRLFRQTRSEYTRRWYLSFMSQLPCPKCQGERLAPEARFVTVNGERLPKLTGYSIQALAEWIADLPTHLDEEQRAIGGELIQEIRQRLSFLQNVGLHYLSLDRPAPTLSGGEGQRIRLASQIGSGLVGVLYILDEPSIGLHTRDHRALLDTLIHLRDIGNTVLVVEHDADTMRFADWIIDLGPGPGILGGRLVAAGTPDDIMSDPDSLTGRFLAGELQITSPVGFERRRPKGWIELTGAHLHNLKHIDVQFPVGVLTCVTGVSGSGKSSLVSKTFEPILARMLNGAQTSSGGYQGITGLEQVNKVINITQDPIGRNPRSNPGTYSGVMDEIRKVFATTPEAKARGYKAGRFSMNAKGGRCEACAGYGTRKVEMHFLPDVWVTCKECEGKRFNRQTLEVTYKGKNIADVLDMDIQEALEFFANVPAISHILQTLHDVGLDYMKIGQNALTLSGGEAQRVKLAKELSRASTGRTVYILDEPTTGLHFSDIQRLLDVLHRLVDQGNSVIIIEHNLDVIKSADWIIDLGPEGGDKGGYLVAAGAPEELAVCPQSHTGRYLADVLEKICSDVPSAVKENVH
jgi:excinuclease ABC subunit A